MPYYERRLPHFDVVGQPLFVTFRLFGSLPTNRTFPPQRILTSGQAFASMDHLLHTTRTGPFYLGQPAVAGIVANAIRDGESKFARYELHAWVVMPNHVHMLVTPHVSSARWLRSLKGFTAHEAHRVMGTSGPFWQDESYDHLVRDGGLERVRRYIELNPVKAGLVVNPEDFPWSSVSAG